MKPRQAIMQNARMLILTVGLLCLIFYFIVITHSLGFVIVGIIFITIAIGAGWLLNKVRDERELE